MVRLSFRFIGIFISFTIAGCLLIETRANAAAITLGPVVGIGISLGSGPTPPSCYYCAPREIYAPVPAYLIGATANIYLARYFGILTGLQWTTRGFEDSTDFGTASLAVRQVGIPLYLTLVNKEEKKIYFGYKIGVEGAIRTKCTIGFQSSLEISYMDEVNQFDCTDVLLESQGITYNRFDLSPSMGLSLGRRFDNHSVFRVDVSYFHGIVSIFEDSKIYTRNVFLQFSYDWPIKSPD